MSHPYIEKENQNWFLSFAAFILKAIVSIYDFDQFIILFEISSLYSSRTTIDSKLLSALIYDQDLLAYVQFKLPTCTMRKQVSFMF